MMLKKFVAALVLLLGLSFYAPGAFAVINAGLQPYDLMQSRYKNVFALTVEKVDPATGQVVARVSESFKGKSAVGTSISLTFTGQVEGVGNDAAFAPGQPIVALVGRNRRTKDLMIYADGFYLGRVASPGVWTLDKSSEATVGMDGEQISTLAGTWNGATEQLVRLCRDIAAGRDHFPRKAYARFLPDMLLDQLAEPATAIAVYDLEGDGDEDIVVSSLGGDRIYLRTEPLDPEEAKLIRFVDATQERGISSASNSCSVGDFNADFLTDILLGGTLYQGQFDGKRLNFVKTALLPSDFQGDVKTAAFAELNGDGFPDIVVSVVGQGLRCFINQAGESFQDATEAMGLAQASHGAGQTGFVSIGDWNGDRRADLFYAAGPGYYLVQDEQGVFQTLAHDVGYKFSVGFTGEQGQTGGGVFLPLLSPNQIDLITPIEDGWLTVANRETKPFDITPWGNEISEGSSNHLATSAGDLNLDGHIDFYTVSKLDNGHNRFIVNRGYGSFMLASVHRHYEHMFAGPAHQRGGTAVAIGDIDNDGAPDLVIGNLHGDVTLIRNDTLSARKPIPNAPREVAVLENTRLLSVRVMGSKGVVNARVQLLDSDKRVVARRDIGTSMGGGSWGPNRVTLAVRQPGAYELVVTYSDGLKRTQAVDLTPQQRLAVDVDRGAEDNTDGW